MELEAHAVMTQDEYNAMQLRGWHAVCRDFLGEKGIIGLRYGVGPHVPAVPDAGRLSSLVADLQHVLATLGDIPVQIQSSPELGGCIVSYGTIFVVAEEYEDGVYCNIRAWPY